MPRSITPEARLRRAREPLLRFLAEVAGLGDRLAALLVQLPASFAFEARVVRRFFALLGELHAGAVVCEPRHPSWFTPSADRALVTCGVGRVAADPACVPDAAHPGGWLGVEGDGRGALLYYRWHGTPRMYWSGYDDAWLRARADELLEADEHVVHRLAVGEGARGRAEAMAGGGELLVRLRQHRRRSGDRQRTRAASVAGLRCSFALEGGDADQDRP